ncbi:NlpC/P60 family protein [Domibacillus indicus]|uniref:C40 family peptidase n=1 Tax=Domibacillus indicus TaxID=1437523 RepID=UPI00203CC1D6|nr:NlpC/P60 family protein [Domibacillus indicus]MCM3789419.1 NlpC/P60 family protein [Domibacillus indicus]
MIRIEVAGQDVSQLIAEPPRIDDPIESITRKFEFTLFSHKIPEGADVEFFVQNRREFIGKVYRRRFVDDRQMQYVAYDPLYKLKSVNDWHFPGMTLGQIYKQLLKACEINIGNIPNTKIILTELWYQKEKAVTALTDSMARTKAKTNTRWMPRYNPYTDAADLVLLETPKLMWSFQVGVNLTEATYEEDGENMATVVKLINRETGQIVTKQNAVQRKKYGMIQDMEEVSKEDAANINGLAQKFLDEVSSVGITASVSGVSDGKMPVFFSADMVYIEEQFSGLLGGYHIRNAVHEFQSDGLISVAVDVQKTAYVPEIQIEDANEDPAKKKAAEVGSGSTTTTDATARINGQAYSSFQATAYDPKLGGINKQGDGKYTATSTIWAYNRTIAVSPSIIPYGSVVHIQVPSMPKYSGIYLAEDTGGAIKRENGGKRVDILIKGKTATANFGRRSVEVTILERGKGPADARNKVKNWKTLKPKYEAKLKTVTKTVNTSSGSSSNGNTKRDKIVAEARKWKGKLKYKWNGKTITNGQGDCSGFTKYVYRVAVGLNIGDGSINQATKGVKISTREAQPGDLVVFKGTIKGRAKHLPSHVGIVTRPGYCVSLASSGCKEHGYTMQTAADYWGKQFMQIRRVL